MSFAQRQISETQLRTSVSAAQSLWAPQESRSPRTAPLTRRYEISYLTAAGDIATTTRLAPAIAAFEEAFSAFARGTVVATVEGPVAVEDLLPGMGILTAEGRVETLTWIGSMTMFPAGAIPGTEAATLTRITAEAFGIGRPMPDLILGPRARLLLRDRRCTTAAGSDQVYAPARGFADGVSIIEVNPAAPITVYHLVLRHQGSIRAGGIEVESFHPGGGFAEIMGGHLSSLFLSLFPHMRSLADFGAVAHPRIDADELSEMLDG
jgi:hypothetical protein